MGLTAHGQVTPQARPVFLLSTHNGEPQTLVAVLVLNKKLNQFAKAKFFQTNHSNVAYHPGLVLPPRGDGSQRQLKRLLKQTSTN